MHAALYYPHSSVNNSDLIKSALLLWDRIEYIKPAWYPGPANPFPNAPREERKQLSEAMELIAVGREPTNAEKEIAHSEIVKLIRSGLPDWFLFAPDNPDANYSLFSEKLLPKTWELLRDKNLAGMISAFDHRARVRDWSMHKSLGLVVMAILAKVCAGKHKVMITDESDAYATWTRCITKEADGQYGESTLAKNVAPDSNLLVTTSISVLSAKSISLNSVLKLRRREMEGRDTVLPTLRNKYYSELQGYLDKLTECTNKTDRDEVQRQFKQAMRLDLARLRDELKLEKGRVLWSKEMAAGLVFAAGTFLTPYLTSAIGIGELGSMISTGLISATALRKTHIEYRAARNKVLETHPMSWLYVAKR